MTPAQQVALDAMRSAWPEETVQRMLFADLTERLLVDSMSRLMSEDCGYCGRRLNDHRAECTECQPIKVAVLRVERLLSDRETAPGASTPRLPEETEQRGGLTVRRGAPVCSHCRDDDEQRLDCRACGGTGLADLDDIRPDAVTP